MKVKVNRVLAAGTYHVNFEVSDFTPDELKKMESFGVPRINLMWTQGGNNFSPVVALNQITKAYDAAFKTEVEAKNYEGTVLSQMRDAMQRLRENEDKFSSSDEVAL